MKLKDIINQLTAILPRYTDLFSEQVGIKTITVSGGSGSIVLDEAIKTNSAVYISNSGALRQNKIVSVSQNGLVFTFTTEEDHDLTENWQESINLSGFSDEDWNADFTGFQVPNRRTFKITSSNALPTITDSQYLNELLPMGVNTRLIGARTSTTTYSFDATDIPDGEYIGGTMHYNIRVAFTYDYNTAVEQYTKQSLNDFWCFVARLPQTVSKDRTSLSDATSIHSPSDDLRLRVLSNFEVYVFANVSNELQPLTVEDICSHDLPPVFMKALLGLTIERPDVNNATLAEDEKTQTYCCVFTGDQKENYGGSYYSHSYAFQVPWETDNGQKIDPELTRAFRDVEYNEIKETAENLTANIDLDDEPL